MKTMLTPGTEVKVCAHCGGTGLCGQGLLKTNHLHQWIECEHCGKGVPSAVVEKFDDDDQRPVCSVCGGRGFQDEH